MRQLAYIHGGESFDTYEEYIEALCTWDYEPQPQLKNKWRDTISNELGDEWQILMPTMPSKYNAKYLEWSIWFEKVVPFLTDGVILVGHSLGGVFLAKFLEQHAIPINIRATFLIAAPHSITEPGESLADFVLPQSLSCFAEQAGALFLYHSKDDDVVPFSEMAKFKAQLPAATVRTFDDRGHFLGPELPELIEDIQNLG